MMTSLNAEIIFSAGPPTVNFCVNAPSLLEREIDRSMGPRERENIVRKRDRECYRDS